MNLVQQEPPYKRGENVTRSFFESISGMSQWAQFTQRERDIVNKTIGELEIGPGSYVLEPGCGAGRLTTELSRAAGREGFVFSFDLSPAMIERSRVERPLPNAVYHVCSASKVPLEDDCMDAAVCFNCFHLFDCPPRALLEMARVLVPGGRLAIVQSEDLEEILEDNYLPEALKNHSIPSPADNLRMLQAFGFQVLKMPRLQDGFYTLAVKK